MEPAKKTAIRNIVIVLIIITGLIVAFSIPLGMFPPLGKLLFPGNGLWNIDEEVPESETLSAPQLSSDVTVLRDEWGVPHIYGSNEEDLSFALGYVQAQDRLFQMDMARRATRGRLSEILGPSMLSVDQYNLNMLKDYWTKETLAAMKASTEPEMQQVVAVLESYVQGVNHYVSNCKSFPLEFQFLGYEPDPWTAEDSLSFIKYMAEMLTWSYADFTNLLKQDALGETIYQELFGRPSPYQVPICPNYGDFPDPGNATSAFDIENYDLSMERATTSIIALASQFMKDITKIPGELERMQNQNIIGSNNWVLAGNKTASGKPLLCNDMHLSANLPGIWYEGHMVDTSIGSDFNVYGFFLAGVPYPIVGHNAFVGWGFTNTGYDVMDWYHYNGENETHYWFKGELTAYEFIDYKIKVKGQATVDYRIKNTVHGPVFNEFFSTAPYEGYSSKILACKWIAHNISFEGRALYGFAHAKNRADFNTASQFFSTPAQNMIYADVHGDIGIRPTGKVPIRDDTNIPSWHTGNGTMPYNGSAGHGEWVKYVTFEDLPHTENPSQEYLTSANQIIAGPEFLKNYSLQTPSYISSAYRARRINTVLANGNNFTLEEMQDLQLDSYSVLAGNFSAYLLSAIEGLSSKTTLEQNAYDLLANWDFEMSKMSSAPSIFNAWIQAYRDLTFGDEFSTLECRYYPGYTTLEWFTKTNNSLVWFDDINTPTVETRDNIILQAFNKTLHALTNYFETEDISDWSWGELHFTEFPHITGLGSLGLGPYPVDGTSNTVCPFSVHSLWSDEAIQPTVAHFGASERLIIDFSDLNNSLSVIPSGQRGISTSEHYADQLELYLEGKYHVQYFGADTIEKFKDGWIESKLILQAKTS